MSETVLITGASGLVGAKLVATLIDCEHRVIASDLRIPAEDMQQSGVIYECLNVCDGANIVRVFEQHQPSVVIHLASIVTPGVGDTREHACAVDVGGSQNILQACVEHRVKRLVVTSSGAAYGYHCDNPVPLQEHHALRGNPAFAYSDHKRQVEELLARARVQHPQLEQVILRVGTVLGERVDNQITALFLKKRLLGIAGYDSPFVFIWDGDLAAILSRAVGTAPAGIFNVCGDGALSVDQLAHILGKAVLKPPAGLLRWALRIGSVLGLGPYGPEQLCFLQFRPVLDNTHLKTTFGYTPKLTSAEAFNRWAKHRGLVT